MESLEPRDRRLLCRNFWRANQAVCLDDRGDALWCMKKLYRAVELMSCIAIRDLDATATTPEKGKEGGMGNEGLPAPRHPAGRIADSFPPSKGQMQSAPGGLPRTGGVPLPDAQEQA